MNDSWRLSCNCYPLPSNGLSTGSGFTILILPYLALYNISKKIILLIPRLVRTARALEWTVGMYHLLNRTTRSMPIVHSCFRHPAPRAAVRIAGCYLAYQVMENINPNNTMTSSSAMWVYEENVAPSTWGKHISYSRVVGNDLSWHSRPTLLNLLPCVQNCIM